MPANDLSRMDIGLVLNMITLYENLSGKGVDTTKPKNLSSQMMLGSSLVLTKPKSKPSRDQSVIGTHLPKVSIGSLKIFYIFPHLIGVKCLIIQYLLLKIISAENGCIQRHIEHSQCK